MNAFAILGVTPETSPADIKRAYRRLAMRWHPDRNDHPEATERFKQIRSAYNQLLAGETPEAASNGEQAAAESQSQAADIRLDLEVSLENAAAGCRQTLHYQRGKDCPTCDGTGKAGMTRTRFCQACYGSGRRHDAKRVLVACDSCAGRGFFTEQICPDCRGSGRESASISLEITVPPGMLAGDELRLLGQGEPGNEGGRAGNLYLTLIIRPHPLFQLRGRDLHFAMPVSALAMIAGDEIEIPSLAGTFLHPLDEGLPEARELRLTGKGYPGRGRNPPGDLVLTLQPVFPARLNARQRKLLRQANAALMADEEETLPQITAWKAAKAR